MVKEGVSSKRLRQELLEARLFRKYWIDYFYGGFEPRETGLCFIWLENEATFNRGGLL